MNNTDTARISINKKDMMVLAVVDYDRAGSLYYCHPDDDSHERNLEIKWLHVKNHYRRKGLATRMLKLLFDSYPNATWISLWTGKDTEVDGSWSLYLKMGFEQLTYQSDYYADNIGTRLMAKRIKS